LIKLSLLGILKKEAPENGAIKGISLSLMIGIIAFIVGVPTKPKSAKTLSL